MKKASRFPNALHNAKVLEKPQAISVKLTVLTLIREINMVAKQSIRDLFHEK